MKKLSGPRGTLEKIFWIFLFVNPFLDIINGLYISLVLKVGVLDVKTISTLGVTPSLVVRMAMLVVFALYLILAKDKKSIAAAVPMGLAWILSMASEYVSSGSAKLFLDTQYTARFCYNIVLLMVYPRVLSNRWEPDGRELMDRLNDIVAFTIAVLSLSILISAVAGVGYSTYADRAGYRGSRGFFYAGNDITAVLALLLPVNVASLMKMDRRCSVAKTVLYAAAGALAGNALMIIGSKTAFIAVGMTYAVMLAAALVSLFRGDRAPVLGFIWAAAAALILFGALMLMSGMELWYSIVSSYNVTGHLAETEGVQTAILSGRQNKLAEQFAQFKNGGFMVWLFGLGRGSQAEILEMDVFEVIFYYGIFGAAAFLWLYVKAAVDFIRALFRRPGVMGAALFTALGMCAGYLFIAGHILFSVTSGFYFIFVIVYSRAYFADNSSEALLWKQ